MEYIATFGSRLPPNLAVQGGGGAEKIQPKDKADG